MSRELKILFINPRRFLYSYPMLGLGFLSSYLKRYGSHKYRIRFADENIGENVYKVARSFNPDIAAITATTPQITSAARIAGFIKALNKDTLTIIGGPHASVLPERTLSEFRNFDIAAISEGERTFLEIVDTFAGGRDYFLRNLEKIKGIVFNDNGGIIKTAHREFVDDLDSIPLPDRELFNKEYYFRRPRQVIRGLSRRSTHLMSSRGCPYDCSYCSSKLIWRRKVRFHSLGRVMEEIDELVNKFRLEAIFFEDDLFIADKNRVRELCGNLIAGNYHKRLVWAAQLKSNLISEQDLGLLKLMKEAGCIQVEFGFESGSQRFLKVIKKGTSTVEHNQRALDIVKKAGIRVLGNFIFGFQGETREDMEDTRNFILNNYRQLDYFQTLVATPYPGTDFWEDCIKADLIKDASWDTFDMGIAGTQVFSNSVDRQEVKQIVGELTTLAFRKVTLKEKLSWLKTRFQDDPRYVVSMILKNIMRQLSFLTHTS